MIKPQSPDTSLALERILFERYRQMSVEEKLNHVGALGLVDPPAPSGPESVSSAA